MLSVTPEGYFADGPVLFQIPVRCAHFNSSQSHRGWIYRTAGDVLSLESRYPFKEGALIMIRLERLRPPFWDGIEKGSLRYASLAKIVSCRDLSGDGAPRYDIVARYCDAFRC